MIVWLTLSATIIGAIIFVVTFQLLPFAEEVERGQRSFALQVTERLLRTEGIGSARAFADAAARAAPAMRLFILDVPAARCTAQSADVPSVIGVGSHCYRIQMEAASARTLANGLQRLAPWITALLASAIAAFWLARYMIRPVAYLRQGLAALAQGHFDVRIGDKMDGRKDEVTALAHDFDSSAERLQQLQQTQQRLFHDVSHELRSPLSRLQASLGILRQSPGKLVPLMDRMDREIQRIDGLIGEILTLARLTADSADRSDFQVLDIIDLLNEIVTDACFEGQARGVRITADISGSFVTQVSGELIYRALENVIRNAVKYTAENSMVSIKCMIAPDILRVTVTDEGPGLPAEDVDKIFRPFWRSDNGAPHQGYGLGLAIAKQALDRHDGHIAAAVGQNGGLEIRLEIPRVRAGVERDGPADKMT
ncbi:HAMP domain-containing sensor histidine kinase [Novosphingobium sp.]|uniref:HAMP domain-containing sensor histidine kinase n=1 Tax=Novosphingobium sp. TaxID=1874826 RepID=UPI002FE1EFF2